MPDYAERLTTALGEGFDSFTARTYARGSMRFRRFFAAIAAGLDDEDDEDPEEALGNIHPASSRQSAGLRRDRPDLARRSEAKTATRNQKPL